MLQRETWASSMSRDILSFVVECVRIVTQKIGEFHFSDRRLGRLRSCHHPTTKNEKEDLFITRYKARLLQRRPRYIPYIVPLLMCGTNDLKEMNKLRHSLRIKGQRIHRNRIGDYENQKRGSCSELVILHSDNHRTWDCLGDLFRTRMEISSDEV